MLLVSYDISDTKLRTHFSKFLSKYGHRLQYSVFEIKNSSRILGLIQLEIQNTFMKRFSQADSIFIFETGASCKITRYGYAKNDESDCIII